MDDQAETPLYLMAIIKPRMDRAQEAENALRDLMSGTHAEPGCVWMDLTVDESDPTTWVMFEKFLSRSAWEAHMETEHVRAGNALLADLLREPTELRFYAGR